MPPRESLSNYLCEECIYQGVFSVLKVFFSRCISQGGFFRCFSQGVFLKVFFSRCISHGVFLKVYFSRCFSQGVFLKLVSLGVFFKVYFSRCYQMPPSESLLPTESPSHSTTSSTTQGCWCLYIFILFFYHLWFWGLFMHLGTTLAFAPTTMDLQLRSKSTWP